MKRLVLSLTFLLLTFNLSYGLSFDAVKVGAGDESTEILVNEPFTIEFYANFTTGDNGRITWSTPFRFYGTGNVTTLTSAGVFVNNTDFDDFWSMLCFHPNNNAGTLESWDGDLSNNDGGLSGDQFNYSGTNLSPPLPTSGSMEIFEVQFDGIVGDASTNGTFCVDSGDFVNNTYDWLLDSPSPSFGPVCWDVIDTSGPPPNESPVLYSIGDRDVDENIPLTFLVHSGDPDGTIPILYTSGLPNGADFTDNADTTGTFSWTPTYEQAGTYPITFFATDEIDTVYETIVITVNDVNRAPYIYPIADTTINQGETIAFTVYSGDPDGTIPDLTTSTLPDGAEFIDNSDTTGSFSWTPTYDQEGVYSITFYADDGIAQVFDEVSITVNNVNRAPVLAQVADGPQYVDVGNTLALYLSAVDPDGTIPELLSDHAFANAVFTDSGNGAGSFVFTPDSSQAGMEDTVRFTATDGELDDFEDVIIIVNQLVPPVLNVSVTNLDFLGNLCDGEVTLAELDTLSFDIANDGEGVLNWTVAGIENWLGFNPDAGSGAGTVEVWIEWGNVPEIAVGIDDTAYLYDTLTVTAAGADNSPQYIEVKLTLVCEPTGYFLTASPESISMEAAYGETVGDTVRIEEMYGQEVEIEFTNSNSWLYLPSFAEPPTTPFTIEFYVLHNEIMPGHLYDTIVVTSLSDPSNTVYVPVEVTVTIPVISTTSDPTSFEFNLELGESLTDQVAYIYEVHGFNLAFRVASGGSWIEFHDHPDDYVTPESVFFDINTTGLTPGVHYDTIYADDAGYIWEDPMVDVKIPVTLTVTADFEVAATPEEFNFVLYQGEATTSSLNVHEIYGREIGFLHYNWSSWLAVDPLGSPPYSTPMSLPIGVSTIGLDSGMYYDTISITPDVDSTVFPNVSVPVSLQVIYVPPDTEDSVWVSTVPGRTGTDVIVPVYFRNFETLTEINLPLAWDSDDLLLTEVSFEGTRVDSVDYKPVVINNDEQKVQINIMPIFSDPIFAGRGLLAKLHFSVSPTADPAFVAVYDTEIAPAGGLFFVDQMMDMITPHFDTGGVIVGPDTAYLCGRVIDTAGNEIEDAFVEIWSDFPDGYWVLGDTTDIAGQFACHSVGVSPFDVYAYKPGYYPGLVTNVQLGEMGVEVVLTPTSAVTPTNEWVGFYCMNNYYSNVPLPVGTVVDAYDPDGVHCGTFYVEEPGKYGIMPVYRDDIFSTEDEGAEPGDNISFFINGYPATTDGETIWTAMGDNFEACLEVFTVEDRTIHLAEGWNLISWNVDTPNDHIMHLLSSVSDCVELVLSFEQGGYTYDPELPEFSTLWDLDHLHGYWVRMTCDTTLVLSGVPVSATTPIEMEAGWNLVSYLPQVVDTIPNALSSIHDDLVVALGYINGAGLTYDPSLPGYSNLNYMGPGYGYWVNVSSAGTLVYPGSGPPVIFKQTPSFAAKAILGTEVSVSRQWMNLYSYDLTMDGKAVPVGAEIKATDADGRVIGLAEMGTNGRFGFMPVYADDPATEILEGVTAGDEFILVVDGVESAESFTWTTNGDRLEVGALTARTGTELMPKEFKLGQNYPNPFNPTTTISFSLPTPMNATVEVFNILGEKVKTIFNGMGDAGENSVVWHGDNESGQAAASGVYFYRLTAGDYTNSKKMLLMK